jgi:hypothetical protein
MRIGILGSGLLGGKGDDGPRFAYPLQRFGT